MSRWYGGDIAILSLAFLADHILHRKEGDDTDRDN